MENEKCLQTLTIENIVRAFTQKVQEATDKILSCLYTCFKSIFIEWAVIIYSKYPEDFIRFTAESSFTDGLLKLKETAIQSGLYTSNASIKTIVFSFCKMKLLENITKEERQKKQSNKILTWLFYEQENENYSIESETVYRSIEKSIEMLNEEDRKIIEWRHKQELTNEEIANKLGITKASATNRIYRCMEKLREITNNNLKKMQ